MRAIIPNLAELIPALISFAVIYFLLAKFAWPALSGTLDKRADTIREGFERAESAKIEAERLLEEYKQTMSEARKEAGVILQQAEQSAEMARLEASVRTKAEYDAMLEKAREAIKAEKVKAMADLQGQVAGMSVAVAGKIIGSSLKVEDHAALIERYMAEVGSLNEN